MRDEKGVYRFPDGEPVTNIQPGRRRDGGSAFVVIISATLIVATLLLLAALRSCS